MNIYFFPAIIDPHGATTYSLASLRKAEAEGCAVFALVSYSALSIIPRTAAMQDKCRFDQTLAGF
jgi:hypothetical protein